MRAWCLFACLSLWVFGRENHSKLLCEYLCHTVLIPPPLFFLNFRFFNNWSRHFPSGTSWRKYCYGSFPNSIRYHIVFHSVFQGKNEKLGFSWYHCKENMQKLTRQMKLSIKSPSEQSRNLGGRSSVTSRNNWDSALKWESWTVNNLFFISLLRYFCV